MSHFEWSGIGAFDFGGDCGVAFFFALSGYGLMSGYGARAASGSLNLARFMRRRLWRIYPMHSVALAVAFVTMPWAFADTTADILSALLLQSWTSEAYFETNGPAWFLSTLVFLYFLFPWLARRVATMRLRTLAATVVVGFALMVAAYVVTAAAGADKDTATRWLYIFPPARVWDFFLGMVIFRFCGVLRARMGSLSSGTIFALQAASMALVAALVPASVCLGSSAPSFGCRSLSLFVSLRSPMARLWQGCARWLRAPYPIWVAFPWKFFCCMSRLSPVCIVLRRTCLSNCPMALHLWLRRQSRWQ